MEPRTVIRDCQKIVNICCEIWEVGESELMGRTTSQKFAVPRHVAMYLMMKHIGISQGCVGGLFDRDHTAVSHSRKTVERNLNAPKYTCKSKQEFRDKLKRAEEML